MTTAFLRSAIAIAALAATAGSAAAQTAITREQVERRHNIRVFENVLVSAAQHGAELLGLRVQQIDPSIILLTGTAPRAQGFVIAGSGVFVHVEIPAVDPPAKPKKPKPPKKPKAKAKAKAKPKPKAKKRGRK
jgi:hypothetical protein